jgi:cation:H+ antiporter
MSSTILLILVLAFFFIVGKFLVRGSVSIALKMQISTLVVGMTIVSIATSAP